MEKNFLVFTILMVIILSAFLTIGYVNQTEQNHRKETIKELVEDAATLIEDKGEDAFPELRQEGTKWFHNDTYVFVWMINGIRVVYPPDLSGEGKNMSTLMDTTGKEIGRLFIEIALSEDGEGWIDYKWPKPGETKPSDKQTYIKRATYGEQTFIVGSGFYLETN
ncbi:MAG: cache domain-containing protein [Candidatus Bathyarchaeum sp.]|nr:MAG: cache domain-containing protein [Candidatus Bathyarchaeum sp.]